MKRYIKTKDGKWVEDKISTKLVIQTLCWFLWQLRYTVLVLLIIGALIDLAYGFTQGVWW